MRNRRRMKLMNGCCQPVVLWAADGRALGSEDVPVSDALRAELLAWQDFFDEHSLAHEPGGWDSPESEQEYARRGRGLQKWLQRELDEPVDLDLSAIRTAR